MSASSPVAVNVLTDHYRSDGFADFRFPRELPSQRGYFRFGETICYGRTAMGSVRSNPKGDLEDALPHVTSSRDSVELPFDPVEIIDNLRRERYAGAYGSQRTVVTTLAGKAYYALRPFMPVSFRRQLQKLYLKGWSRIPFPSWPVDRTADALMERLLQIRLQKGPAKIPFIWFWPDGYSSCLTMTHDVETEDGRDFCLTLAKLDAEFGLKPAFQIVPEERYTITHEFLDSLRNFGCEINLHGLNHGPNLFRDRAEFLRQAERIHRYAVEYGASGFRSPGLYRNVEWFDALRFSYDMSVPNSAHLEPQRGGCCTVMPYFIESVLELPLTMTQDYTLFHILGDCSIGLWKREMEMVLDGNGLVSFNTHPDYLLPEKHLAVYRQLLEYVTAVSAERRIWCALPGEINTWWRQRHKMKLMGDVETGFTISGTGSDRAVVAFASSQEGRIVYELMDTGRVLRAA